MAWMRLAPSRQSLLGGAGVTPLSEISAYFDIYGITDPEDRDEFVFFIQQLDDENIAIQSEKADSKKASK